MKRALRAIRLIFFLVPACAVIGTAAGCKKGCTFSDECDQGQHCDITGHTCIDGCKSNRDCSPALCDTRIGRCFPSGSHTRTSTIPDVGPVDARDGETIDGADSADGADGAAIDLGLLDGSPTDTSTRTGPDR